MPPLPMRELEAVVTRIIAGTSCFRADSSQSKKFFSLALRAAGRPWPRSVVSSALSWPLAVVRLDTVVSSFLGETATNLRRIFDFINQDRFVVLFDEFDALGKERDRGQEHGELQRVVTALLQLMDGYHGESLMRFRDEPSIHAGFGAVAPFRQHQFPFELPKEQDRLLMLRLFSGPSGTRTNN